MPKNKSHTEANQSSTNVATTNTTNTDNKIVADNGSIAASGGSTINFLSKDVAMEALETAAELGKTAIGNSGKFMDGTIDIFNEGADIINQSNIRSANLARDLSDQNALVAGQAIAGAITMADRNAMVTENSRIGNANLARDLATTAIDKVEKNAQSADVQVLSTVGKYGAWIAAAIAAAVALFLIFRSKKTA